MLIPAGKILHKELSTKFTNTDDFFKTLHESRFTGYVKFEFWQIEGWILVEMGNILQAYLKNDESDIWGIDAYMDLQSLCREADKEGSISSHQIEHDLLMCLISISGGYKEILSDQLGKELLSEFLEQNLDSEFTGFVTIIFGTDKGEANIFYLDGKIIDTVVGAASGKVISGLSVFQKLDQICTKVTSRISINESSLNDGVEQSNKLKSSLMLPVILPLAEEILFTVDTYLKSELKDNGFEEYFLKASNELANEYEFLDPFLDEFHYGNGKLQFEGFQPTDDFLRGFFSALKRSISPVKFRNGQKEELFRLIENRIADYPEEDEKFSITSQIAEI